MTEIAFLWVTIRYLVSVLKLAFKISINWVTENMIKAYYRHFLVDFRTTKIHKIAFTSLCTDY